ncbi:MAG TPA: ABC-three component system protein [Candidatus Thermoplasmatota archaeon]|nr:ABC-three component system protein [Candidatus Thermoplasmatota archaeon]
MTKFVLSSTNDIEPGSVFEPFTLASTTEAEREALLIALHGACLNPSVENAPACKRWTEATDDQRRRIVAALRVEAGQPSINRAREEIVQRLLARSFHERAVTEAAEELVGWVEMKIRERISPTGCFITVAECRQKLGLLRDKFTIVSLPRLPPDAIDFEAELSTNATYLRQLNLIKTERDELVSAISTYAEANRHRKYWLNEGLLGEDRVDQFERQLLLQWNSAKGEHAGETDEIRGGKRVYYQCLRARGRLGPDDSDPEMIAGNYHVLSQRRLVGWHPRYRELLGDE